MLDPHYMPQQGRMIPMMPAVGQPQCYCCIGAPQYGHYQLRHSYPMMSLARSEQCLTETQSVRKRELKHKQKIDESVRKRCDRADTLQTS